MNLYDMEVYERQSVKKKRKIKDPPTNEPLTKKLKYNGEDTVENLVTSTSYDDEQISEDFELSSSEENKNILKPEILSSTIQYISKCAGSDDDEEIDVVNIDEHSPCKTIVSDADSLVAQKSKLENKRSSNKSSPMPKIKNKTIKPVLTLTEGMQKLFSPSIKQSRNVRCKVSNVNELKAIENVLDNRVQNKKNINISGNRTNKRSCSEMSAKPITKNKLINCNSVSKENESVINFENNNDLSKTNKDSFGKIVNVEELTKLSSAKVILYRINVHDYLKSKQSNSKKRIFNAAVSITNKITASPTANNKKGLKQTTLLQFYNTKSTKDVIEKSENTTNKTVDESRNIIEEVPTKTAKIPDVTTKSKFSTENDSNYNLFNNSSPKVSKTSDLNTSKSQDFQFLYCNDCNYKTSKGKSRLLKHIQNKHSNEFINGIIKCQCGKKFRKLKAFKLHQTTCGLKPHLKCPFCPLRTKYDTSIKKHVLNQHKKDFELNQLDDILYKIAKKGKAFKAKALKLALQGKEISNMKEENKTEKRKMKNKIGSYCTHCNESFNREYNTHMVRSKVCLNCDKLLQFQCLKCKKIYSSYEGCWNHIKYYCEQPEQKNLHCNDCSYTTFTKYKLQTHIERKHTEIDPKDFVKCPNCGKGFKNKAYMKYHKLNCGKSKDHHCQICSYKTKYIYQLNKHMKQHAKHSQDKCTAPNISNSNSSINVSRQLSNSSIEAASGTTSKIESSEHKKVQVIAPNSIESLEQRTLNNLKLATYICLKCKAIDPSVTVKLIDCKKCHIKMHYNCKSCNRTYKKWGSFCQHLPQKCATANNYQCEHCDRQFTIKDNIRRHIFAEHMTKVDSNGFVKCPKCKNKYKGRANMLRHKTRCGKVPDFKCKLCDVKCSLKHNLRKHMQRKHENLSPKEIENALNHVNETVKEKEREAKKSQTLKSKSKKPSKDNLKLIPINKNGLQIVSLYMTKEEKKNTLHLIEVKCPSCSKSYTANKIKKNHMLQRCFYCKTNNVYRCVQCSKTYGRCRELRKHIKREHLLDPHQHLLHECSNCGKHFTFYENLRIHWEICLKLKDIICDYCGFSTKAKRNLVRHIKRKHLHSTMKKEHECVKCTFRFLEKEGLQKHIKTCIGGYKCDECGAKFVTRLLLINHIQSKQIH